MFILLPVSPKANKDFISKNIDKEQFKKTVCAGTGTLPKIVNEVSFRKNRDNNIICFVWINTQVDNETVYIERLKTCKKISEFIERNLVES